MKLDIEKILALIESFEPPADDPSHTPDYDKGYRDGYTDAVDEIYRAIDETEGEE